jgi:hypothetical protein
MTNNTNFSTQQAIRDYSTGRKVPIVQLGNTMNPTGMSQAAIAIAASRVASLGGVLSFRPSQDTIGAAEAVVYEDREAGVCVWRHGPAGGNGLRRSWVVGPWAILAVGTPQQADELDERLQRHWPVLTRMLLRAGERLDRTG